MSMWKQHNHNLMQMQEKLAEREARIRQLQQESRNQRAWVPESRLMNTASQREIMQMKKELKELYQKLDQQEKQKVPEKKTDDNDQYVREQLQKMQQELAHMHTLVKKQRNALLLAQVSPRKTRSKKVPKKMETIPEEPEPSPAAPAPPQPSPAKASPAKPIVEPVTSEEVQDTPEEEEPQPDQEQ